MSSRQIIALKPFAALLASALAFSPLVSSAPTDLANGPLATAGSSTKPNIMFVLDDSGSMQQDATPDYVQTEKLCRRTLDNTDAFSSSSRFFEKCRLGDPPYMSAAFNFQYYNPAIRYRPALNADGTERTSYSNPTEVPTDPFGVRKWNQFYSYGQVDKVDLTTQYPDRVWCDDASDSNSSLDCRRNGSIGTGYQYPGADPAASNGAVPGTRRGFSRDPGFTARCSDPYPDNSPPAPDFSCSSGQSDTVQFPKYRYGAPYYYNVTPVEHCTNADLTSCIDSLVPTGSHPVPAVVRWCSDPELTNCQARKDATFRFSRLAFSGSVTIEVTGSGSATTFTGITINGIQVLSSNTTNSNNNSTLATSIRDRINSGNTSPLRFRATSSGSTVTIFPSGPVLNDQFTVTFTRTGGARSVGITAVKRAARFQRVDIVPGVTSYPKSTGRTDCAGATCSYAEEITNFANWYAYYRTRMNMAKSAVGIAFSAIDSAYRVGFLTINPVSGGAVNNQRYLRVEDFVNGNAADQKPRWYEKLYGTGFNGSTPLREALSRVGRYYAGITDGINSGMDPSPIQRSCQQNFTILSTDGYWNGNRGKKLDGSDVGNQDNVLGTGAGQVPRPLFDGNDPAASDTLADVAQYYYATDLRPDLDDNVPTTQKDTAAHQHMTTFTIGLGLAGRLKYESNYETSTTGDFFKLKQGTLNWPVPSSDSETALDDLWHAAVNGRGTFFSARDPEQVVDGLASALSALQARVGAGAAAATSNLQPVAGDNFAFTAEYTTKEWTGDLKARELDLNTGAISATPLWSAQALLEGRTESSRVIFAATSDVANFPRRLKSFDWTGNGNTYPTDTTLTAAEQAFFATTLVAQYGGWSVAQRTAATPKSLVKYLRGDKTNYDTDQGLVTDLYRSRTKLLGDIINAQPAYMKISPLGYGDPGHAAFVKCTDGTGSGSCPSGLAANAERIGTVYVAANDGMLHAFESAGANPGRERWAFIPSSVLPNLYKLANNNYAGQHQYYVDGSPTIGDICIAADCKVTSLGATSWRTILVGGLNAGGRGFYALDITNPTTSEVKLLWEFKVRDPNVTPCNQPVEGTNTDCDLGFSFGNPIITKRKFDGKWVVLVTSGYNNVNPGSGQGFLYMLDAQTGIVLKKIGLSGGGGTGGTATPALCVPATILPTYPYCNADPVGLAKINVQLESNETDNTALYVYGGDLKGRMWKWDISSEVNTSYASATLMATALAPNGTPQPITTKPEIGRLPSFEYAIFFGTGRYLGNSDPSDLQRQTVYAIKASVSGVANARSILVSQTLGADQTSAGGTVRTITSTNDVNWTTGNGWYIDLPVSGERVNVDPSLQIGTLVVASNAPTSGDCSVGGVGYLNYFDYLTGRAVVTSTGLVASYKVPGSLIVGTNTVKLPGNKLVTITTTADNQQLSFETPISLAGAGGKRISWREVIVD